MKLSVSKKLLPFLMGLAVSSTSVIAEQQWGYTYYDDSGLIETADGPRTDLNDITTYSYNTEGDMTSVKNALAHIIEYDDFNGRGQPQLIIDANGVKTILSYHPRGWLASFKVMHPGSDRTLDAFTEFQYDGVGQLRKTIFPDNSFFIYEYDDARRLRAIENPLGERIEYTPDSAGNIELEQIRASDETLVKTLTRKFDELNRLKKIIGAANQTMDYDYDNNGNPEYITDGKQKVTHQVFDGLNRVTEVLDRNREKIDYDYDDRDRLTDVYDQRGLHTHYDYDVYDNLEMQTSPDTGITKFVYDDANNLTQRTDAKNVVTNYKYDELNRLTRVTFEGKPEETIVYRYDGTTDNNYGVGRLTSVTDSSGENRYQYDHRGNVIKHTQIIAGNTYVVSYQYDLADKLVHTTYPDERNVTWRYSDKQQLKSVSTSKAGVSTDIANNIVWMPFGGIDSLGFGNGLLFDATYDQDYRIGAINVGTGGEIQQLIYGYDANNNIDTITHGLDNNQSQTFTYEAEDRLETAMGEYGNRAYQYDPVGNRKSLTNNGQVSTYEYSPASNQLDTHQQWNYDYDNNGNLTSKTTADQQGTYWVYDERNRLVSVNKKFLNGSGTLTEQQIAHYQYNALGQRVSKTVEGKTTDFIYSLQGQLLGESTQGPGTLSASYVYLNGQPLSYIVVNDVYTVHNDHLNTPKLLSNSVGNVVWRAKALPFGETSVEEDVDGDGNSVVFNTRFPGQYFDQESGVHYNYFRDYDPKLGRYIQSDPIGLRGGLNTYAYVDGNPLRYADPKGLAAQACLAIPGCVPAVIQVCRTAATRIAQLVARGYIVEQVSCDDNECPTNGADDPRDRELPRDPRTGEPIPDPEAEGPHTQLGKRDGRNGKYDQGREFDADGKPVRDIDFTDHGRPQNHPNPHQHPYNDNPTGGTKSRSKKGYPL